MIIEVAVQTWKFNKRLCWMLSSIIQQVDLPADCKIVVSLAFIKDTGVEDVLAAFANTGLVYKTHVYPNFESFARRGFTRNKQATESFADWIMFADSDMVYPRDFFSKLIKELSGAFKDNPGCLILPRYSNEIENTDPMINAETYPGVIADAAAKVAGIPLRMCRNIGAGYCQIANIEQLVKNHGGLYMPGDLMIDGKPSQTRSDKYFRKKLGVVYMPDTIPVQMHIQHLRGRDDLMK